MIRNWRSLYSSTGFRRPRLALELTLVGAILAIALYAFGGPSNLLPHSRFPITRTVARALLLGHLEYPFPVFAGLPHQDFEMYNGAYFTHWGYGAPLLQVPFHLLARLIPSLPPEFVLPDRLIFFLYLCGCIVLVYCALRVACVHFNVFSAGIPAAVASAIFTLAIFSSSVFWLIAGRFVHLEEVGAYFVLLELYSLGFYLLYASQRWRRWVIAAGASASLGLLTRPPGLVYLAGWLIAFYLLFRERKVITYFLGAAFPGVLFWLISNDFKTGSPFSFGFQNSVPGWREHFLALRFGSPCASTLGGAMRVARHLFSVLFLSDLSMSKPLTACKFTVKGAEHAPFVPLLYSAFCLLALFFLIRKRNRLDPWVPLLGIAFLFGGYVYAGAGFEDRYTADFWPFLILFPLQVLIFQSKPIGKPSKLILLIASLCLLVRLGSLSAEHSKIMVSQAPARDDTWELKPIFEFLAGPQRTIANLVRCEKKSDGRGLNRSGLGWNDDCTTNEVTQIYLGLPPRNDGGFQLVLDVDSPPAEKITVYLNGKYLTAHWDGTRYVAPFRINEERLHSRNLMTTVQWSRTYQTLSFHLKAIWIEPVSPELTRSTSSSQPDPT